MTDHLPGLLGYAQGVLTAADLKAAGVEVDVDELLEGLRTRLDDEEGVRRAERAALEASGRPPAELLRVGLGLATVHALRTVLARLEDGDRGSAHDALLDAIRFYPELGP